MAAGGLDAEPPCREWPLGGSLLVRRTRVEFCFLLAYLNQHLARLGSSHQSHVQPLCRLVEPPVETGQAGAKPLSEF